MFRFIKKYIIPHEMNNFHPHSVRHGSFLTFSLLLLIANYFVFPLIGISSSKVLAANISVGDIVSYTNSERQKLGLASLSTNSALNSAAYAKGNDMLKKQYWSHYGPSGESPWMFMKESRYAYTTAGENLARNFQNSLDMHKSWMNSPTHKANIINSAFKDIGVAVLSGSFNGQNTILVVQMFGSTVSTATATTKTTIKQPIPITTKAIVKISPTPTLSNPVIKSPKDLTYTNEDKIEVSGEAEKNAKLKIFNNSNLKGELPNENAAFTVNVDLEENENNIFVKSSLGTQESKPSNQIKVIKDHTNPNLDDIDIQFIEKESSFNFNIESKESLSRTTFLFDNEEYEFDQLNSHKFEKEIPSTQIKDSQVLLYFYDLAGNRSSKLITLPQKEEIATYSFESSTALTDQNDNFFESILNRLSLVKKINLSLISLLMLFVLIDAVIIFKKGISRDISSHSAFNLALILLIFLSAVAFK